MTEEANDQVTEISNSGRPEVANNTKQKNPFVLVISTIVIAAFIIIFFVTRHSGTKENQNEQQAQESYDVNSSAKQATVSSAVPTAKIQAQKVSQISDQEKLELIKAKQQELHQRLVAPMMAIDNQGNKASGASQTVASKDPNMQFMNQVSSQKPDVINATAMGSLHYLIAEGSLIHAVLETAVNSDLPGYLRAIVTHEVYSEDGEQVLIPPGSRLIGQYKSGMLQGQSRVFVVWTRLITPKGISLSLASPGVDNLGVAGMGADSIDHHFWQQFGTAMLLSIIGAGADNIGVSSSDQNNASQAYREAVADSFAESANQSFRQGMIPPTLHIDQGKPIMVFVAHDLNFQDAMKQTGRKLNIF